jgi:hypothetical protein
MSLKIHFWLYEYSSFNICLFICGEGGGRIVTICASVEITFLTVVTELTERELCLRHWNERRWRKTEVSVGSGEQNGFTENVSRQWTNHKWVLRSRVAGTGRVRLHEQTVMKTQTKRSEPQSSEPLLHPRISPSWKRRIVTSPRTILARPEYFSRCGLGSFHDISNWDIWHRLSFYSAGERTGKR